MPIKGSLRQNCAGVIIFGVQEYSHSPAVAHFEAVQLDEEDGKVSLDPGSTTADQHYLKYTSTQFMYNNCIKGVLLVLALHHVLYVAGGGN